jgi:cytoskeletal protein RodZ
MAGRLGERLKDARKQRGVALDEVQASTKIHRRYLEALERQDWSAFPGTVFARGYLRTYSEYLGLDPERMLKAFAREHAHANPNSDHEAEARMATRAMLERLAESRGVGAAQRRRRLRAAAAAATVGLVAAGALWAALRLQEGAGAPAAEVVTQASLSAVESWIGSDAAPQAPAAQPLEVTVPWAPPVEPAAAQAPSAPATTPDALPEPLPEETTTPSPPSPARLSIEEHGVGSGVSNRQLLGASGEFVEGSVVWFWTHVQGGHRGDRVQHVWLREGREIGIIPLRVAGEQWRTQSRRKMGVGSAGRWTVEARDVEGRVLASTSFDVVRDTR